MNKIIFILMIIFFVNIYGGQFPSKLSLLSPGIKLGYTFGENSGFTYGFEISYIDFNADRAGNYGCALSYDICGDYKKLHFGLEGFLSLAGIDIGPTILFNDSNIYYGYSITPFAGFLLYPYFSYSKMFNFREENIYEVGGYGKLPFPLDREDDTDVIINTSTKISLTPFN